MYHKSRHVIPHKQITQLNIHPCCKLEIIPCDIKSMYFYFDQCNDVIPTTLTFYNSKVHVSYEDVKIVKIVDDVSLDKKYDSDNSYLLHYNSDYVKLNYRHLLSTYQNFKDLVGSYIIDWNGNKTVLNMIKNSDSKYIEMNYYIFENNPDDE